MNSSSEVAKHRIACIIPTYNGYEDLYRLLTSLDKQTAIFDLFIVDSSSQDNTDVLARSRCANVVSISSDKFNHGGTRQMMIDKYPEYDIYIFLTQDAYLENEFAISTIAKYFVDPIVGAACGRQLPHHDATLLAQHARIFNYPEASAIKSMNDVRELGIKTAFMSNSFSAYRGSALSEVGGFPHDVILSEDMFVAAKMLLAGWSVAYAGDACCRHSHNYTLIEEFRRYFDIGVFHSEEPWIKHNFGGAGGEGIRYVLSELSFLSYRKFYVWPSSIIRNGIKLLGYKLGLMQRKIPVFIKLKLSMHRKYWADTNVDEAKSI